MSDPGHLDPDLLECAFAGTADADDWRAFVRHLLTACPECRARAAEMAERLGLELEEGGGG